MVPAHLLVLGSNLLPIKIGIITILPTSKQKTIILLVVLVSLMPPKKTNNSASDCTSSTECNSEGDSSDRNSDNNVYNVKAAAELGALSKRDAAGQGASLSIPTPAPRTTLEKSTKSSLQSSIRSMSVDRVKQVRHESLV